MRQGREEVRVRQASLESLPKARLQGDRIDLSRQGLAWEEHRRGLTRGRVKKPKTMTGGVRERVMGMGEGGGRWKMYSTVHHHEVLRSGPAKLLLLRTWV